MPLSDADLKAVLLEQNYLTDEEIAQAEKDAKQHELPLKSALFELGLLTQDLLENAIAEHFKLQHFDPQKQSPSPDTVLQLPEEVAKRYAAVLVEKTGDGVTVATADPFREELEQVIRLNVGQQTAAFPGEEEKSEKKAGGITLFGIGGAKEEPRVEFTGKVTLLYAPQSVIDALMTHYRKPLATRFQSIIEKQKKVAPEILEEILNDAIELRASDIHFEPQGKIVIVRFRVDGVMHEAGRLPKEYYEGVVNRIKIAGNMRIDEHFAAQDGAIRYEGHGEPMDVRVSIVPVVDGEKVCMRLLSSYVRTITLTDLGFTETHRQILEEAAQKPFGMILTAGPTGAGKSTTLYALLKIRNHPDVNISTIEDPVEYKIPGINHIQVNPKTNLTFASGLRALVRQDPDIVLVGEIRDGETANIAVNAALTGHLLFSTVHANDAATAVPRLLDMGVEPFLLASTLEVIVSQRLVRRLCPQCRYSISVTAEEGQKLYPLAGKYLFPASGTTLLYKGKGCEACGGTGYHGRVGIHELLRITPEVEELIIKRASSSDISDCARRQGMKLLFEDGYEKAKRGLTSLEELLRVAAPPELLSDAADHASKKAPRA